MDRYEARKAIVEELEQTGALVQIEDHNHNVGGCYRCSTVIEPIVSRQWFVSMKELAKPAIQAVRGGDVEFIPARFDKIFFNWMDNVRDWCISRQLWWGHRIPAYYCDECGHMMVDSYAPNSCEKCSCTTLRQDEDALDTWFSSGLWPFSTLGWPDKTPELEFFYPTSVLVTGYDIIFFWVARMIVFGMEVMGEAPFKYVNVHGIVRDAQGRKMSKSLGNGIDPLEIIENHGADALRFSLANGSAAGADMRFSNERVEAAGNFANKIWNAARFVLMNKTGETKKPDTAKLDIADKWILSRLDDCIKVVTENMEKFELGLATSKVYDFVWSEYCDWYIEMAKPRLYGEDENVKAATMDVLQYVLANALKLLHPFMPFITEEIYTALTGEESIMIAQYPVPEYSFAQEDAAMERIMSAIKEVRAVRAQMNVPPSKKARLIIKTEYSKDVEACEAYLMRLAYCDGVEIISEGQPENVVSCVCELGNVFMPMGELIDIAKELDRLSKEKARLEQEIKRAHGKLSNEKFTAKAPQSVVEEERSKLHKYENMLAEVCKQLEVVSSL